MEKLPSPAAAANKLPLGLHSLHLHSRFCSILASIFCFWWVASLLHFQSSTTLLNTFSAAPSSSNPAAAHVGSHQAYHTEYTTHEPHPHAGPALDGVGAGAATTDHDIHGLNIHDFQTVEAHHIHEHMVESNADGVWHSSKVVPSLSSSSLSTINPLTVVPPSTITKAYPTSPPTLTPTSYSSFLSSPSSSLSSPPSSSPLPSLASPLPSLYSSAHPPQLHRFSHNSLQSAKEPSPRPQSAKETATTSAMSNDLCNGKYVYMHSLPPMFNQEMISNCTHHSPLWVDFCTITSNGGLGPILEDNEGVFTPPQNGTHSWYSTDQFILDVIFHSRMKKYKCLTSDSSKADLIYVPFYAGLDLTRYLWRVNVSVRDYLPNALADWLPKQPEWKVMEGRDHFFVTGKISWDFRRSSDEDSDWGNKLLELPALKDVSVLLIEKSSSKASRVEHAIPYPTYFHPHKDSQVYEWQSSMRAMKRPNLFVFAGASRPEFAHSIRGELIEQCRNSTFCKLLECTRGKSGCNSPSTVMKLFQGSQFCLQPSGDSYTRRSVFDSMVAGCIPVLFHPYSVYTQYNWHLPEKFSTYSVYIPEEEIKAKTVDIERILRRIPASQVQEMREKVISLLPSLIYAHHDNQLDKVKDAFDVAMEALLLKVAESKKRIRERAAWLNRITRRAAAA